MCVSLLELLPLLKFLPANPRESPPSTELRHACTHACIHARGCIIVLLHQTPRENDLIFHYFCRSNEVDNLPFAQGTIKINKRLLCIYIYLQINKFTLLITDFVWWTPSHDAFVNHRSSHDSRCTLQINGTDYHRYFTRVYIYVATVP